jgi:hypothetical protein
MGGKQTLANGLLRASVAIRPWFWQEPASDPPSDQQANGYCQNGRQIDPPSGGQETPFEARGNPIEEVAQAEHNRDRHEEVRADRAERYDNCFRTRLGQSG